MGGVARAVGGVVRALFGGPDPNKAQAQALAQAHAQAQAQQRGLQATEDAARRRSESQLRGALRPRPSLFGVLGQAQSGARTTLG